MARRSARTLLVLFALGAVRAAAAQEQRAPASSTDEGAAPLPGSAGTADAAAPSGASESAPMQGDAKLAGHLSLLAMKRLTPPSAQSVEELDALLEQAHARTLAGRSDEAALLLLEAVEGPRFRAFESLDSFAAAELALVTALIEQHALETAQRGVERLLARGTKSPTFGPAFRRGVDIALARRDYEASADRLAAQVREPLPRDAESELHYLRGLAAYDAQRDDQARRELGAVHESSRFHVSAQYLLGTVAARRGELDEAHGRFCKVRKVLPAGATRALYASPELVASDDDARLALGRIEHERGRSKEAFAHYHAVPADSPRLAEALFESAYASYERGHHGTALDSLDQLEARYPRSPFTAEARVLRGYAHLGRCDFDRAERELVTFEQTFRPLLDELDGALERPASSHALYERSRERGADQPLLEALVARDPEVERIRTMLAALDAELARASATETRFAELAVRVRSGEAPRARRDDTSDDTSAEARARGLRAALAETRAALASFDRELRKLGRSGGAQVGELRRTQRALAKRVDALEAELRAAVRARTLNGTSDESGQELATRLEQERAHVASSAQQAERLRADLEEQLARAARTTLLSLRERLAKELRRARIGRIDAVMGKKRKLELEVESLAAGRFPAELSARTRKQTLLRDDEEYWPYEGEDWPDEFAEPRARPR
jgi:tetratricopeptide (TPR) repeat protein